MKLHTLLLTLCLGVISLAAQAEQTYDYHLQPRQIAADTWVLQGRNEEFSLKNGGNIVNTAFIVTGAGVVVIDTGPSREYGEEMVKVIAKITQEPIVRVFNTHHHPDHFLGNQAFPHDLLEALPETIASLGREGNALTERMYQMAGDWMKGTEPVIPQWEASPGDFTVGRHKFRLMSLHGHTGADMALLDSETGVLFAADLVFNGRAPTTPHAQVDAWLKSLD
ncbi:MAG TPA: quinoprotein relay system zinc metallohydrolase 1, partial [Rhodocyclaceae bacterium]